MHRPTRSKRPVWEFKPQPLPSDDTLAKGLLGLDINEIAKYKHYHFELNLEAPSEHTLQGTLRRREFEVLSNKLYSLRYDEETLSSEMQIIYQTIFEKIGQIIAKNKNIQSLSITLHDRGSRMSGNCIASLLKQFSRISIKKLCLMYVKLSADDVNTITKTLDTQHLKIESALILEGIVIPNNSLLNFIENYFTGYILECQFNANDQFVAGLTKLPQTKYIEKLIIKTEENYNPRSKRSNRREGKYSNDACKETTAKALTETFRGYHLGFPKLKISSEWRVLHNHPTIVYFDISGCDSRYPLHERPDYYMSGKSIKLNEWRYPIIKTNRVSTLRETFHKTFWSNIEDLYNSLALNDIKRAKTKHSVADFYVMLLSHENKIKAKNLLKLLDARIIYEEFMLGEKEIDAEKAMTLLLKIPFKSTNILAMLETLSLLILQTPMASQQDEDVSDSLKNLSNSDKRRYELGIIGLLHLGPNNSSAKLLAHRLRLLAEQKLGIMQQEQAETYLSKPNNIKVISLLQKLYKVELELIGDKVTLPMPQSPMKSVYTYYQSLHHPICMLQIQTAINQAQSQRIVQLETLLNSTAGEHADNSEGSSNSPGMFG